MDKKPVSSGLDSSHSKNQSLQSPRSRQDRVEMPSILRQDQENSKNGPETKTDLEYYNTIYWNRKEKTNFRHSCESETKINKLDYKAFI